MKKISFVVLALCCLSWMFLACEPQTVEPLSASARNPEEQQPATPPVPPSSGKNCEVTITNASTNPFAHLHIAIGAPDMSGLIAGAGCPIAPGASATICLPRGETILYPFSNMYQFGPGIKVTIGAEPISLRMRSGH